MRIRRLRLHNFRRYRDAQLEFPDGVTALLGPNGAGKSTLLEAIGFALFGPAAARTGKGLLRSQDAPPGDAVEVELELELGGHALRIQRSLRGKQLLPQASLEVDGLAIVPAGAGSSEAATGEMERRLGMDRDAFFTTIVARQGELSRLADASPADRKRLLLRMLGIDQVDRAVDAARQHRREADLQLEALRRVLPNDADLQADLQAAAASQATATRDVRDAQATCVPAAQALVTAQAAVEETRRLAAARATAEAALRHADRVQLLCAQQARAARQQVAVARDAEARVAALGATLERLTMAEEAHRVALAHEAARRVHAGQVQRHAQQAARVERLVLERAAVVSSPALVVASSSQGPALESSLQTVLSDLAEVARQRAVAQTRLEDLDLRIGHLDHLGDQADCPTCMAPLGGRLAALRQTSTKGRAEIEQALAHLEPMAQQKAQQAAHLRREQQRLVALQQQAQREAERAAQLDQQIERERALLDELKAQIVPDPGPMPDLVRLQREAFTARQAHDERTRCEGLANRLPALLAEEAQAQAAFAQAVESREQAAAALPPLDAGALLAAQSALAAAETKDAQARLALQAAQLRLAQAESRVAAQRQRLAEAARGRAEEARLEREAREWAALVGRAAGTGLLERFRDHLVARVGPAISHEAGRLLARFTGGRYSEVFLSPDYEVFVADGAERFTLDRFSGGEQDLVHLALRLAVSRLLAERGGTELRFLALDEVFGSLDRGRRDLVVGSLQELGGLYAQVLVITHHEGLREELGQALVVGEDETGGATLVSLQNG